MSEIKLSTPEKSDEKEELISSLVFLIFSLSNFNSFFILLSCIIEEKILELI